MKKKKKNKDIDIESKKTWGKRIKKNINKFIYILANKHNHHNI